MIATPSMQQLLEAGVHFGHQVSRGSPKMTPFIYGARDGVHVINLEVSEKLLKEAAQFAKKLGEAGKVILFVGTKKQSQPIIAEASKKCDAPYLTHRWIGGVLTNFEEIRKNIKKLLELKEKQEKGELSHYTKKEQLLISRKLTKFDIEYGGTAQMESLPDAIFLADCVKEKTALVEANRLGIPVIGIADTNSDPTLLAYPIPGNDDATKSIKIITETIANAYDEGLKKGKAKAVKEKSEEKEVVTGAADTAVVEDVAVAEEEVEKAALEESERKV